MSLTCLCSGAFNIAFRPRVRRLILMNAELAKPIRIFGLSKGGSLILLNTCCIGGLGLIGKRLQNLPPCAPGLTIRRGKSSRRVICRLKVHSWGSRPVQVSRRCRASKTWSPYRFIDRDDRHHVLDGHARPTAGLRIGKCRSKTARVAARCGPKPATRCAAARIHRKKGKNSKIYKDFRDGWALRVSGARISR